MSNDLVLPAAISLKHVDLKEEFVSRVRALLTEPSKIKNYAVSDDWNGESESADLEIGNYRIALKVTMTK